ncbi:MAG: DUF1573 domain-containing protein [Candidatus Coatesbacteria bacterium]|nr:DUF1573 domain-containing protein [Candidatus Coatesbacteria bacterium]
MRIVFLIIISLSSIVASYGPEAVVSDSIWNVGDIKQNEIKHFEITIWNKGSHPLVLKTARGTCNCVVADYPKQAIQMQKSGKILLGFRGKNMLPGEVNETVYLHTNDTGNQIIPILIKANVIDSKEKLKNPGIKLKINNVEDLEFGVVPPQTKIKTFLKLYNPSNFSISVKDVRATCACTFLEKIAFSILSKTEYTIPVVINTKDKYGHFNEKIYVTQNNLVDDVLEVKIHATLLSGSNYLDLYPNILELLPEAEPEFMNLKVKNNCMEKIDVEITQLDSGLFVSGERKFNLASGETREFGIYIIDYVPASKALLPLIFNIKARNKFAEKLCLPIFFREAERSS